MALTSVQKFAAANVGTTITETAHGASVVSSIVYAAKDTNKDKLLNKSELSAALSGESTLAKSAAWAAYNAASKTAGGTPKRSQVTAAAENAAQSALKADEKGNGDWVLDRNELETFTSSTAMLMVKIGRALADTPNGATSTAELAKRTANIMRGVNIISEGDSAIEFVRGAGTGNGAPTEADMFSELKKVLEEYFKGNSATSLDEYTAEVSSAAETAKAFKSLAEGSDDPLDDYSIAADAFAKLSPLFAANLSDVRSVRVGPKADDGSMAVDQGLYVEMLVGRDSKGKLVGVAWTVVET